MAYSSSTVTKGRARGIVIATGMQTAIGAIAESLRGGDSKVRKVRRNDDGHAPWHRYPAAWGLTTLDIIGQFLGVTTGTPLQRTLSWLAIGLFLIGCVFALFVFAANDFRSPNEVILYAIATALSMIPASLVVSSRVTSSRALEPILMLIGHPNTSQVVLTITLAGGTKAMAQRNVIVRKLDSLEALGAVTDICSDKTGTLTQGKMVVRAAWIPSRGTVYVGESNEPFNPTLAKLRFSTTSPLEAARKADENKITTDKEKERDAKVAKAAHGEELAPDDLVKRGGDPMTTLLNIASLCNVAKVFFKEGEGWSARGDPTECAIQTFAHRFGWGRERWTEGDSPTWSKLVPACKSSSFADFASNLQLKLPSTPSIVT